MIVDLAIFFSFQATKALSHKDYIVPERKLPFRQKSEYRNSKLETISNIKFFNVQNKSIGIRLFRAFENSNL